MAVEEEMLPQRIGGGEDGKHADNSFGMLGRRRRARTGLHMWPFSPHAGVGRAGQDPAGRIGELPSPLSLPAAGEENVRRTDNGAAAADCGEHVKNLAFFSSSFEPGRTYGIWLREKESIERTWRRGSHLQFLGFF